MYCTHPKSQSSSALADADERPGPSDALADHRGSKGNTSFKYKLNNTTKLAGNSNCSELSGSQQS